MISYRVTGYEIELDWSILEKFIQIRRKISTSANILSRVDIRWVLFIMELDGSDMFEWVYNICRLW